MAESNPISNGRAGKGKPANSSSASNSAVDGINLNRLHYGIDGLSTYVVVVAVSVRRTGSGTHAGILYQAGDSVKLLHMRWHFAVEAAPPNDRDAWSVPDIPPERLEVIAGHCRQIERLGLWGLRMPFGLMYVPGRHINTENLSITLCDGVIGFSCATFVLHFFDTVGIRLLDVENWRSRAQDTEIQRRYVEQLRAQTDEIGPPKFGADYPTKTHVEAAESQIGCFRYRPEEVAAACLFDDLPVDIDKAEPAGKRVLQFIDEQSARADQQGGGFM